MQNQLAHVQVVDGKGSAQHSKALFIAFAVTFFLMLFATLRHPSFYILPAGLTTLICLIRLLTLNNLRFGYLDLQNITWLVLLYTQGLSPFLNDFFDYYVSLWSFATNKELREAMGYSSSISLAGVFVFFALEQAFLKEKVGLPKRVIINKRVYLPLLTSALGVCGAIQFYIFSSFGGIAGYLQTWSEDRSAFAGYGWLYMLAEPFPVIALLAYVGYFLVKNERPSISNLLIFFLIFLGLKLIFGGFRGSRANTVWGIFWFVSIVNLYFYNVSKKAIILGGSVVFIFVVSYSLYKSFGHEALEGGISAQAIASLGRYDGRPIEGVMLEDFSRSGIQAGLLNEYIKNPSFEPKLGATYLGSILLPLPKGELFGFMPSTKTHAATELFYGEHYGALSGKYSSRIFGIFGEGILNFTPWLAFLVVFPAFLIYRTVYFYFHALPDKDPRLLLYPLFVNLMFIVIVSDADNVVFFLIKNGLIPGIVLFMLITYRQNNAD